MALLIAGSAAAQSLRIAVASNFAAPMEAIAEASEAGSGLDLVVVSGSTGKLAAQIRHGAPFDLFFAADTLRPFQLERDGHGAGRFTYAVGRLALYAPDGGAGPMRLQSGDFRKLAVAHPDLAPYGRAAMQALKALGVDVDPGDIVRGENVAQAFHFTSTGNAELGFVAASQVVGMPAEFAWIVPGGMHDPIEQQAVVIRDTPAAAAFLDFVRGEGAAGWIEAFGYRRPAAP